MDAIVFLMPIALFMGFIALAAFIWNLRSGQFDDLEGAKYRILIDDDEDRMPSPPADETDTDDRNAKNSQ